MTNEEAYRAMYYFLENYLKYIDSDEIKSLLGGLSLLEDGSTADPAFASEWLKAVEKAKSDPEGVKLKFI